MMRIMNFNASLYDVGFPLAYVALLYQTKVTGSIVTETNVVYMLCKDYTSERW